MKFESAGGGIAPGKERGMEVGSRARLAPLLAPRSIAFVGASVREGTPGHTMLYLNRGSSLEGRLYPVNPRYPRIDGVDCYASLEELPEVPDLVVLGIADGRLESALQQAASVGARAAVIFGGANLEEPEQTRLVRRLRDIAAEADLPICGGNCMGYYNLDAGLRISEAWARAARENTRRTDKPIAMVSNFPWVEDGDAVERMSESGIPVIGGMDNGLAAARHLFAWRDFRARKAKRPPEGLEPSRLDAWRERLEAGEILDEAESLALLADYGIDVVPCRRAASPDEIEALARELDAPVALKTAMPGVHHKSGGGGGRRPRRASVRIRRRLRPRAGPPFRPGDGARTAGRARSGDSACDNRLAQAFEQPFQLRHAHAKLGLERRHAFEELCTELGHVLEELGFQRRRLNFQCGCAFLRLRHTLLERGHATLEGSHALFQAIEAGIAPALAVQDESGERDTDREDADELGRHDEFRIPTPALPDMASCPCPCPCRMMHRSSAP